MELLKQDYVKLRRGLSLGFAALIALVGMLYFFTWIELSSIVDEGAQLYRQQIPAIKDVAELLGETRLQAQLVESGAISQADDVASRAMQQSIAKTAEIYARMKMRTSSSQELELIVDLEGARGRYLQALSDMQGQRGTRSAWWPALLVTLQDRQRAYFDRIGDVMRFEFDQTDLVVRKNELAADRIKVALFVVPLAAFLVIGLLSLWLVRAVNRRMLAESEARTLANFDPLTSMPNRRLANDRLRHALAASARSMRMGAVMLLDLDDFKTVNDRFGHETGDQLLLEISCCLTTATRRSDTVARMGGDEFLILLEDVDGFGDAESQSRKIANDILGRISIPFRIRHKANQQLIELRVTATLGIALFRGDRVDGSELIRQADLAMYEAKTAGKNRVCVFRPEMQAGLEHRAGVEEELRRALKTGELTLHFQAIVDAADRIVGAEALIRWNHPSRGLLPPSEFLDIAEDAGLMVQVGWQVLRMACHHLQIWSKEPMLCDLTLSVNLSASQLSDPRFGKELRSLVNGYGIDTGRLILELTESVLLDRTPVVAEQLLEIVNMGIAIALDDFGTGYSSLSYLRELPIQRLKIDRSFTRDVATKSADAAVVHAIIALGQSRHLVVIAEGVEEREQRDRLFAMGCGLFQGYMFGRPESAGSFLQHVFDQQATSPAPLAPEARVADE